MQQLLSVQTKPDNFSLQSTTKSNVGKGLQQTEPKVDAGKAISPGSAVGLPGSEADPAEVHLARLVLADLKNKSLHFKFHFLYLI